MKLREELIATNNLLEINYSEDEIFDVPTVKACVFILKKGNPTDTIKLRLIEDRAFNSIEVIERRFLNDHLVINQDIRNNELKILQKLKSNFDFGAHFKVKNGIKIRKDLVKKDSEGKNPKRFLLGRDVEAFLIKFQDRYIDYDKELESKYTNQAFRDPEIFDQNKLIVRQIPSERIIATYDNEEFYCDQTTYVINNGEENEEELKFILALLTSKIFAFYHKLNFSDSKKTFPKVKGSHLSSFPYLKFNSQKHNEIVTLVDQILKAKRDDPEADTSDLEAEIDGLVYELYGLSEEEIKIVEESIKS